MSMPFFIETLGEAVYVNSLGSAENRYVPDERRLAYRPYTDAQSGAAKDERADWSFELAGPRARLYFQPATTRVVIVSCGGLCPGINAVIRALVMQLWHRYGCRQIWGAHFGYQGLAKNASPGLKRLSPDELTNIHETGGTILGSSRGTPPTSEIVASLADGKIDVLFTVGGDGTMRGALAISAEAKRRQYRLAVVGIPKTIDNDIPYVRRSFGFETAVAIASQSLHSAHIEASSYDNTIGLVRLMGRHSGYIAACATLATGHANFCLIPEVPFYLEGETGLLRQLEQRLSVRRHALVVVAEGAGQHYFRDREITRDASGNAKLGNIGFFLKEKIDAHFQSPRSKASTKYIDPSYLIRSAAANPADQLFCARLAQNAVHAAMAGKTAVLVGYWHGAMTHVPLAALGDQRQSVNPVGDLWFNVLETTGQPQRIGEEEAKPSS